MMICKPKIVLHLCKCKSENVNADHSYLFCRQCKESLCPSLGIIRCSVLAPSCVPTTTHTRAQLVSTPTMCAASRELIVLSQRGVTYSAARISKASSREAVAISCQAWHLAWRNPVSVAALTRQCASTLPSFSCTSLRQRKVLFLELEHRQLQFETQCSSLEVWICMAITSPTSGS